MKKTLVYGIATAAVVASLGGLALTTCRSESIETLYGPPPMDDPEDDPSAIETLYGPPPMDDPVEIDEPIEDVYGAPVDFDVDDDAEVEEIQPALYGPPIVNN